MVEMFLRPDAVFEDGRMHPGAVLHLQAGQVRVLPSVPENVIPRPLAGVVSFGLIDLQVNGGGGVLFNATPTVAAIAAIVAAMRPFGTLGLLPTIITDAPEVLEAAADAVIEARGMPGVLGLHIEGPHIALAKRGTHDPRYIRPLDSRTLRVAERLRAADVPVLLTLAPEAATPAGIATLAAMGVVVSIGHSNATADQVAEALAAGARNFTHLFNAMSPMEGRAPGVVGAAILSTADVGIICDGIHVSDEMVQLAIRAHGAGRMHLVSDAMPTVGGPDRFMLYGCEVHLQNGALVNAEGSLAGAHVTLAQSVLRLTGPVGLPLEMALAMAITNPARVIGANVGVTGSSPRDLLIWPPSGGLPRNLQDVLPA